MGMISFLQYIIDNLLGFINRYKNGCCRTELIRAYYDRLLGLGFEVHQGYDLTEDELFKQGRGDCQDRSLALARYMIRIGCTGVQLLYMKSIDPDEAGHVAVLHDGYVYDPTMDYWHYPDWNYKSLMKSYKDFYEVPVTW